MHASPLCMQCARPPRWPQPRRTETSVASSWDRDNTSRGASAKGKCCAGPGGHRKLTPNRYLHRELGRKKPHAAEAVVSPHCVKRKTPVAEREQLSLDWKHLTCLQTHHDKDSLLLPARQPGLPRRRGVRRQCAEVPQPAAHRQAGGSGQPSLCVHLRQLPRPGWQDVHSIGVEEVSARFRCEHVPHSRRTQLL